MSPDPPARLPAAAWKTDRGLVRPQNEDAARLIRLPAHGALLAVVCDGMGGHGGGEIASRVAVDTFRRWPRLNPLPEADEGRYEWLLGAFYAADEAVRKAGSRRMGLRDMGATAVAALLTPRRCLALHAGDCRFYRFRSGAETLHSADHSLVRILVDTGRITEEQALTHPMRSTITSCLGGGPEARLTVDPKWAAEGPQPAFVDLQPGDTLLLCSDGLWGEVPASEIEALVREGRGKPRLLAEACVAAAHRHGAADNITVAALCVR
jgi:serine/threonine protein phosphatase PrpC